MNYDNDNAEVRDINRDIKKKYGKSPDGRSLWRLVFTRGLTERRIGSVYNGLHLPTAMVQDLRKYSYLPDCFVLEELVNIDNPELVRDDKTTYEIRWAFLDADRAYLQPNLKAVEFIIYSVQAQRNKLNAPKTEADHWEEDRKAYDKAKEFNIEALGGKVGLGEALHTGEAVSVQGLRDAKNENSASSE